MAFDVGAGARPTAMLATAVVLLRRAIFLPLPTARAVEGDRSRRIPDRSKLRSSHRVSGPTWDVLKLSACGCTRGASATRGGASETAPLAPAPGHLDGRSNQPSARGAAGT